MSAHSKLTRWTCDDSIANPSIIETRPSLPSDSHFDPPLLSRYDRKELLAREDYLKQLDQRRNLEIAKLERKAYADSLVDQFELIGSDLPADANPRQMHLF